MAGMYVSTSCACVSTVRPVRACNYNSCRGFLIPACYVAHVCKNVPVLCCMYILESTSESTGVRHNVRCNQPGTELGQLE